MISPTIRSTKEIFPPMSQLSQHSFLTQLSFQNSKATNGIIMQWVALLFWKLNLRPQMFYKVFSLPCCSTRFLSGAVNARYFF